MNRKRKYAYAAMTTAVLSIIAVIIFNMIVNVLSDKVTLKIDLTEDRILDFSDTTEKVIDELDMNVEIISLIPENDTTREVLQIKEILEKYDSMSDNISYSSIDPRKNPTIITKYQDNGKPLVRSDSGNYFYIIFKSDRMYDAVAVGDLVQSDVLKKYWSPSSLSAEQYFTSALVKVTKGSEINAYVCSGHGEVFNAEIYSKYILPGFGYNFEDIDLKKDDIPENADMLIIASPSHDYTLDEFHKIDRFVNRGGRLQVFVDVNTMGTNNLFEYLENWNITVGDGIVCEDDSSKYILNDRKNVIANISENQVTSSYNMAGRNINVIIPEARPLYASSKNEITVSEILTTSDNGFVKKNIDSSVNEFEAGDENGKASMAVMASKSAGDGKDVAHIFVMGTTKFLGEYDIENPDSVANSSYADSIGVSNNIEFYSKVMAFMTNQPDSFYIEPKDINQDRVAINQKTVNMYGLITIVVIPVVILAFGFIMWTKRRHL